MDKASKQIHLKDADLIGEGRDRLCFQHPSDPSLCIKVAKKKEKQTAREIRYLNYLHKKQRDLTYISDYHHSVKTNYGKGHVFDLITDQNGSVAPSLYQLLSANQLTPEQLNEALSTLSEYLSRENLCVFDLSPRNLAAKQNQQGQYRLYMIDGIGLASPDPFTFRMPLLTKRLMGKRWRRLIKKITVTVSHSSTDLSVRSDVKDF